MRSKNSFIFLRKLKLLRVSLILMINLKKKQCTRGKLEMLNNICLMLQENESLVPFDLLNLSVTVFELIDINSKFGEFALEVLVNVLNLVKKQESNDGKSQIINN